MSLKDAAEKVQEMLKENEEIKGEFIANCMPPLYWYFIIGPLAAVMMKQYWITLTDKRMFFTRLNMLQKPLVTDDFNYESISKSITTGKVLTRTMTFELNGKKLKLTIPFRKSIKKNMLSPETLEYLEGKF
jgi:hypothetical protein